MTKKYKRLKQKKLSDLTVGEMVYMNACECIYYGYSFDTLNTCGLGDFTAKMIWNEAFNDLAETI